MKILTELQSITTIVLLTVLAAFSVAQDSNMNVDEKGDPVKFFAVSEASLVTWSHAVNSEKLLASSLTNDTIMMLEADVNLQGPDYSVPRMAHSPDEPSDITLEEWLKRVIAHSKKGIKLDFKTIEVAQAAIPILNKYKTGMNVPLWLNADIIGQGPANSTALGVDPMQFLQIGANFPESTLSIGWTTTCPENLCGTANYRWEHVFRMMDAIEKFTAVTAALQTITFPVRAAFVGRSIPQLRWLLDVLQHRNASLTIWTNIADVNYTTADSLLEFRTHFPANAVYYDLLDYQKEEFESKKGKFLPKSATVSDGLGEVIEPLPVDGSMIQKKFLLGSETLVLTNGQSFRTRADYFLNSTSRFQLKAKFYFSRQTNFTASICLILRPGSSGSSLRFSVQSDGTLTLQQCAGVAAEGQSSDSTADWSMVWTKNVGFFSDFFTLLAVDDVDRNTAKFSLLTENNRQIIHEHSFAPTSTKSSVDLRNSPIVFCDSTTSGSFVVVEEFVVDVTRSSSARVTTLPLGIIMTLALLLWF